MRSLAQLLIDNAEPLGVPADCVHLVMYPAATVDDDAHRLSLTVTHHRTMPAPDDEVAMGNLSAEWDGEVDWFLTVFDVRITCRPAQAGRNADYYPNEARRLESQVRAFLRGRGGTGRIITRTAYDKPGVPAEGDGVAVWQRSDTLPQVEGDPAQEMVLSYELLWWAPAPTA